MEKIFLYGMFSVDFNEYHTEQGEGEMADYLLIQRRVQPDGDRLRITALRVSFVRLPSDSWAELGRVTWTKWVEVWTTLEGAKSREMIEVTPETLREVLTSQFDLVRLMEDQGRVFDAILKKATRVR